MAKSDLLMIRPMDDEVVAALEEDFTIHRHDRAEDKAALLAAVGDRVRHVATGGHHGCSAAIMDALPRLELIASFGVGYEAVDVDAARRRGIRVTNTPDVLNDAVAEMTLALMLALCRRIPQADQFVRQGRWLDGKFGLTDELTGRRAGILGLGRVGKEIARRLRAFRMEVAYHGRSRQEGEPYPYYDSLEAMARAVDWLIVIAPATPETAGIVGRDVLEALGPGGCLVNVARGSLVDEAALVELLANGGLRGAALDVFAEEPDVPEALLALPNVVLSPHQGSATHRTRAAMGTLIVANLRAHLRGETLISPVA